LAYLKVEGLVLKNQDYKEADKLLTIYTPEGKTSSIAKGVRKVKSKMRGGVQLFCHSKFELYQGRSSLATVTQCETINSFASLRTDLDRFAHAVYMAEITVELVPDREPNKDIFYLLLTCLHFLENFDPGLVTRLFEIRIINLLGYAPELNVCFHCGSSIEREAKFSLEQGGLLCSQCSGQYKHVININMGTLASLKALSNMDLDKCCRLRLSGRDKNELSALLGRYIELRLDKKLRSREFLNECSGSS